MSVGITASLSIGPTLRYVDLFLWFFRGLIVAIFIGWLMTYRQVRDDPNWMPGKWWRLAYVGPLDRDRMMLNAKGAMLIAPIFLAITFLLPALVRP